MSAAGDLEAGARQAADAARAQSQSLVALLSGVLFALGLALGGMTDPARVLGFLDVAGSWDPSLAFVMVGAIAVHFVSAQRARRPGARPVLAPSYVLPRAHGIDKPLIVGAALFGLGWGTAGFCPGPALASLVALSPSTLLFVASMLAGMLVHGAVRRRSR